MSVDEEATVGAVVACSLFGEILFLCVTICRLVSFSMTISALVRRFRLALVARFLVAWLASTTSALGRTLARVRKHGSVSASAIFLSGVELLDDFYLERLCIGQNVPRLDGVSKILKRARKAVQKHDR